MVSQFQSKDLSYERVVFESKGSDATRFDGGRAKRGLELARIVRNTTNESTR